MLQDNDEIYRHHKPTFEFDLYNGETCYIGKIIVESKIPPPGQVEILISHAPQGPWRKIVEQKAVNDETNEFILPGEQYAKYLQIKFLSNKYGGNFVGIRHLVVKGLKKAAIIS